jgi:mRNA-degrading endonuclease RelE of RelBE toxin-antitoxin system
MEDFVDIIGYEGLYKINQSGQVLGVKSQKLLKPRVHMNEDSFDLETDDNKLINYSIRRLLALHFLPNPDNLPYVEYINELKNPNVLNNLKWVTHRKSNSNIVKTRQYTFRVLFQVNWTRRQKTFKTFNEAKVYRDNVIEHRLLDLKYSDSDSSDESVL